MEFHRVALRVFVGLIVLSSAVVVFVPTASAQNPVPAMQMTLIPTSQEVEITASQPGAATFYGNVSVTKASYERAIVTLQASVSTGWPASVSPSSMVFATTGTVQNYQVSVIVPPGESAVNIGQLLVSGRATAAGLASLPVTSAAVIIPSSYFRVVVAADTPFIETSYSTMAAVAFKIYNEGNIRDTVTINIANLDELSEKGWLPVLTRNKFQIGPPPESQAVQMQVGLPKEWSFLPPNQVQTIILRVSSDEAATVGKSASDQIPIFFRVVGLSTPGFDAPLGILAALVSAFIVGGTRQRKRRLL
jgi:hypothetical protein